VLASYREFDALRPTSLMNCDAIAVRRGRSIPSRERDLVRTNG